MIVISSLGLRCTLGMSHSPLANPGFEPGEFNSTMKKDPATDTKRLALGKWGATGIVVTVLDGSVSIDLPCANASIAVRPKLNAKGEFDAVGRYNQEGPGAIAIVPGQPEQPVENGRTSQNARFHGKVTGKQLRLTITMSKTGEVIGTYNIESGKTGRMFKCL